MHFEKIFTSSLAQVGINNPVLSLFKQSLYSKQIISQRDGNKKLVHIHIKPE